MKPTPGSTATFKGTGPVSAEYARGGEIITSKSRFMKTQDTFRTDIGKQNFEKSGKGGELSKLEGETKVKTPVKPKT
jgi:hypothetical protein